MFTLDRITQISQSHCGPAVTQMLLSHLGYKVSQKRITEASGAKRFLKTRGTRVDQLSRAVRKLAPSTILLYKKRASIRDIKTLIKQYKYPVGVEWQGIFKELDEDDDGDLGHYSAVVGFDRKNKEIIMLDPTRDYKRKYRRLKIAAFRKRWWDRNIMKSKNTGRHRNFRDIRILFIIARKGEEIPLKLNLKSPLAKNP